MLNFSREARLNLHQMNYDTPFYYLLLEKEGLIELGRVDAAPDCDGLEELVEDVIEINGTNDCQGHPFACSPQVAQRIAEHYQETGTHEVTGTAQVLCRIAHEIKITNVQ